MWTILLLTTMLVGIVAGGSSTAANFLFFVFRMLSVALLALALIRLYHTRLRLMETLSLALICATLGLIVLQLVPLPYQVYKALPGREFAVSGFAAAGVRPGWQPLSLDPAATTSYLVALMPPIAMFLATLLSGLRDRLWTAGVILAATLASIFLGLLQRLQGTESPLYIYEITNRGSATGFFSNSNNFAMLACVAIPLMWFMCLHYLRDRRANKAFVLSAAMAMLTAVIVGLAVSGSRSGLLLGMTALLLSAFMSRKAYFKPSRSLRLRFPAWFLFAAILLIGQFGMVGLLRIAQTDPVGEYRSTIAATTILAGTRYFPVGSGFGTFQDIYAMHEQPFNISVGEYVNHAHNDWLEIWLEGGLPAALLLAIFVALFIFQTIRVWLVNGIYATELFPKAASIGVLVLLGHSFAEYPLRMPALAIIFAMLMAILISPRPERRPREQASEHIPLASHSLRVEQ